MLKIRLSRTGRKHAPLYTIVATDHRNCRDGKFLSKLGFYNPNNDKNPLSALEVESMKDLLSKGAILSDTVRTLLKRSNVKLS
jgi:small subunit ribosomal protein S16